MIDRKQEGQRLKERAEGLFARVLSGDIKGVAKELDGLDVPYDKYGLDEFELLRNIARKVFSGQWSWDLEGPIGGRPFIVLISYTEEHREMM
jgi:hypothetical protein